MILLYEIAWYRFWWLAFIAIAFVSARCFGRRGAIAGAILLGVFIYILDAIWITGDVKSHPEHGRDPDFVFLIGVLLRIILFNIVLLPVTLVALRLRRRSHPAKNATETI